MRASALIILAVPLALGLVRPGAADEPCARREPSPSPATFMRDRVAYFREYYSVRGGAACAKEADVQIEWREPSAPERPPLHTEHVSLRSDGDGPSRVEARLFPSAVCDSKRRPSAPGKRVLFGPPGREKVAELVSVRAEVKATGAAAPLAMVSPPVDFPCPVCPERAGAPQYAVRDDGRAITLDFRAEREWFECARYDATLSLLVFAGDSQRAVVDAVTPSLVVDGLEQGFAARGPAYELHRVVSIASLCATNPTFVAFELWGRGELMAAGGGGREVHAVRCR